MFAFSGSKSRAVGTKADALSANHPTITAGRIRIGIMVLERRAAGTVPGDAGINADAAVENQTPGIALLCRTRTAPGAMA